MYKEKQVDLDLKGWHIFMMTAQVNNSISYIGAYFAAAEGFSSLCISVISYAYEHNLQYSSGTYHSMK